MSTNDQAQTAPSLPHKHDAASDPDNAAAAPNPGHGDETGDTPPPKTPGSADEVAAASDQDLPNRSSTLKTKYQDQKQKLQGQKEKIKTKAKGPPGGFDPTPIPVAPPGYTIKFTFHRAENLPTADIGTGAADPFLNATLSTSLPKRHKEDPDLFYRTRTIRRSLEPKWEEEWVVANVPASGFRLKCRLYDEDWPDQNDRLGNVTIHVHSVSEDWEGFAPPGQMFEVQKRVGSKRAYFLKAVTSALDKNTSMTPRLYISAVVLGKSDPPHGQIYTVGPSYFFKHFSPMIGRMAGIKVNKDEGADANHHHEASSSANGEAKQKDKKAQQYDFQANEFQLAGPVPSKLYHRYVEFRPIIGRLFRDTGLRGRILHKALHHQHDRIYNFDKSTQWGTVEPCSEEASLQFLKMAHFDEGGRIFTYVITLDGLMRFTETGKEFGIDLLSKHTMHSDAQIYIACSGEFFIRRLSKPGPTDDPEPSQETHPDKKIKGGPPHEPPPPKPQYYQLVIDNDSGTYRPDKSVLPDLREYLERNFPGLGVVALACDDDEDQKLKAKQREFKKKEGRPLHLVMNRSPSSSSLSSDDLSDLDEVSEAGEAGRKSKRERALEFISGDPGGLKEEAKKRLPSAFGGEHGDGHGEHKAHAGGSGTAA